MRVLGIDPGSNITGYGVVDNVGGCSRPLTWGTVTPAAVPTFSARLRCFHEEITRLVSTYHPDFAAVEDVFYAQNVRSALKLGHTRGAILLSLELAGVPAFAYTPLEIKKAVVGYGRASKEQVRDMARLLLNLRGTDLSTDASDALAAALCHIHTYTTRLRLATQRPGV